MHVLVVECTQLLSGVGLNKGLETIQDGRLRNFFFVCL